MAQQLQIVACTASLVALLAARLPLAYDSAPDVREAGKADFSDAGELVLKKVAVRVRFGDAGYGQTRDISKTTLSAALSYQVICRHESLRSDAEQRNRTLALIQCVQEELAGARLLLSTGSRSDPIELVSVAAVSDQYGPVDDCFGLTISVPGFSQFDGRNSNPRGDQA